MISCTDISVVRGHSGLSDVKIQLIDRVNGEKQVREKEGQWVYRLKILDRNGLNDNDFFLCAK